MTEKEYAKYLWKLINPHTKYWDCYNDCPIEYDHTMKVCYIFLDEIIKSITFFKDEELISYYKNVKKELKNYIKNE